MPDQIPYIIASDAIPHLIQFCKERNFSRFFLVADSNTYNALGKRVERSLVEAGHDVKSIILTGDEISTNEHYIVKTFIATNGEDRQYLAVGSGTITDITRFVSHRSHAKFISLPTAASVDGYTSTVAPMAVGQYKSPIQAQPPVAVFADLPTLCSAPDIMLAAGFGDLLGKYTSLADWRLGALLSEEPYDAEIEHDMRASADKAVASIDLIARKTCEGVTNLMDGLVGSGFGMLKFGDSRPASGSEHHLEHYWEMRFIMQDRPAVLHGIKVGIATILTARRYDRLRQMSQAEAVHRLSDRKLDTFADLQHEIEIAYGSVADKIMEIQAPLFRMTKEDLEYLKQRILNNWGQIQKIARAVPTETQMISWIRSVNGPTTPEEIGLSPQDVKLGLKSAHLSRDRFTLNRLAYWLQY